RNVGFGIIDIADYQQSGPETLVVAMYGSPATASVAHAPVPATPATLTHQTSHSPAASTPPKPVAAAKPPAASPASPPPTAKNTLTPAPQPQPQRVARLQLVARSTTLPWSTLVITLIGILALAALLLRHSLAWHKFLVRGERFVLHHPIFDL